MTNIDNLLCVSYGKVTYKNWNIKSIGEINILSMMIHQFDTLTFFFLFFFFGVTIWVGFILSHNFGDVMEWGSASFFFFNKTTN